MYVCVFSIDLQCKCFHSTVIEATIAQMKVQCIPSKEIDR